MKKIYLLTILILGLSLTIFAQQGKHGGHGGRGGMAKDGSLHGKIVDLITNKPVQYANVALYSMRDSSLVSGAISDANGMFTLEKLPYGKFYLVSDFIGYYKQTTGDIKIFPKRKNFDCGVISLKKATEEIESVEITGERNNIEYKIDRKVINISKDLSATGGTVTDALENTPSIHVDIDGNVQLRGSSSFLVLIDGKPTALDASDALNQIPASTVESVEIITNPSAKFDPDGTSGIINIIMKKEHKGGFNGIINLSAGTRNKYSADFLVNYRAKKFNVFVGGKYSDSHNYGGGLSTRKNYPDTDSLETIISESDMERSMKAYSGKMGIDYYINKKNSVSVSGEYGYFGYFRDKYQYNEYQNNSAEALFSSTDAFFSVDGFYYTVNADYKHEFAKKGHEIIISAIYSDRDGGLKNYNAERITDENYDALDSFFPSEIKTYQDRGREKITYKLDYTYPISNETKIEAGYQGRDLNAGGLYSYEYFDQGQDLWFNDPTYSNDMYFLRNIHSVYSTFSSKLAGISYMAGLRGEYTDRLIEQKTLNEQYTINRFDLFPSLHLSKELPKGQQVLASYSRRTNRPRYWYLNPFPSYSDSYSTRKGNPDLSPEYVDSYELGYQNRIGKSHLSAEFYYRQTNSSITRTQTLLPSGILLSSFDNLDKTYSYGTELSANMQATKWLRFFAMANLYNYNLEGEIAGVNTDFNSTNYNFRLNTTFIFAKASRLQVTSFYRSASATAQGESKSMVGVNFAYKHEFFKRKLSVSLKVRDPFKLSSHDHIIYGQNFYTESIRRREQQVVRLGLSYKINNYERRKPQERDDVGM